MGSKGEYRSFLSTVVVVSAFWLLPTVAGAGLIPPEHVTIDDFRDDGSRAWILLEAGGTLFGSDEDTGLDPSHVIGGVRELTLDGTGGGLTTGWAETEIFGTATGGSMETWLSEDAESGATLELHYGTRAPSGSELNSNWSALEVLRVTFNYVRYDDTPIGGFVELYWNVGGLGEGSMPVPFELPYADDGMNLDIPLTDFTGVDLTDIDGVRVEFGTSLVAGQNFGVTEIAVIPEPATLLVLAAGALGLLGRRRRD